MTDKIVCAHWEPLKIFKSRKLKFKFKYKEIFDTLKNTSDKLLCLLQGKA